MSSNPYELGPNQPDKAAEDIAAAARRIPMITMLDVDEDLRRLGITSEHINRWSISPEQRTRELLYWISGNQPPQDLASIKPPVLEEPAAADTAPDGTQPEFFVKEDVTPSDVVEAIKQQLRPDEQ